MFSIFQDECDKILDLHEKWLNNDKKGKCANFKERCLCNLNLSNRDLRRINFSYIQSYNSDFSNSNLSETNLTNAYFYNCNLSNVNFKNSDMGKVQFNMSNLSNSTFNSAYLEYSKWFYVNASGVNLSKTFFDYSSFRVIDFSNAIFPDKKIQEIDIFDIKLSNPIPGFFLTPLHLLRLLDPNKKIIAYKCLKENLCSPVLNCQYELNKTYTCNNYDTNDSHDYAFGIHVGTKNYAYNYINKWKLYGYKYVMVKVEFRVKDIVAIPYRTKGKLRVKKCKILGIE